MKEHLPRLKLDRIRDRQVPRFMTGLAMAVCLSALGVFFQQRQEPGRCSLDGSLIHSLYEVEIVHADTTVKRFSCLRNARIWVEQAGGDVSFIRVTDEMTCEKIAAERAFYVLSRVVTTPHTENRIHVFASLEAARSHARHFDGVVVDNPLRVAQGPPVTLAKYRTDGPNHAGVAFSPSFKPLCAEGESFQSSLSVSGPAADLSVKKLLQGHERRMEKPPKV